MLQGNGYSTAGFGKWHLTPDHLQGAAGPFDRWPNAWGFDHFWGFLGGEAGQYDPVITQDNTTLGVPRGEGRGEGVLPARRPDRPGGQVAAHGPGAGPDETVVHLLLDRVRARAASGDDGVEREVPGQVRRGLGRTARGDLRPAEESRGDPARRGAHPAAGRVPGVDSLSESERRLYARQMEVYAGYQENCDWNVGRLLDAVQEMGQLDNTLVIYIFGDNGASMEGTITGAFQPG